MYYIDTPTRRIDVLDFDNATGTVANRRPLTHVGNTDGWPDGLTVDADGCVWVALWGGRAVRRYTPRGELDREIALPVDQPDRVLLRRQRLHRPLRHVRPRRACPTRR